MQTLLTPDRTARSTRAAGSSTATALDEVHDLLARLTDDPALAATSLEEVVRRTAGRIEDGIATDSSPTALAASAHRLAVGLAAADRIAPTAEAVTDLAVLDLIVRRGLPLTTVSEITGVAERELAERRARAAGRLAESGETTGADAERRYVRLPAVPAPAMLRHSLADLLHDARPPTSTSRPLLRTIATALMAVLALAALAVWTPRLVSESRSGPAVVEAVPSEFVPEARPIADLSDTSQESQTETAAESDEDTVTSEGAVLLPDQQGDTP